MKRLGAFLFLGLGVSAVAAILAPAALAGAPRVGIELHGSPYAGSNIAAVELGPNSAGITCEQYYKASINSRHPYVADTVEGEEPAAGPSGCFKEKPPATTTEAGYSTSRGLTSIHWGWNEQVTTRGVVTVSEPGPCIYNFTHLGGNTISHFPTDFTLSSGTATGYLVRRQSLIGCAVTESEPVHLFAYVKVPFPREYEEPLEMVLFG
jgi:hypothetical protein